MMDLKQFMAWFEGYSENIEEAPTPKQWARIKARIADIDTASTVPDAGQEAKPVLIAPPVVSPPQVVSLDAKRASWLAEFEATLMMENVAPHIADEMLASVTVDFDAKAADVARRMLREAA